MSKRDKIVLVLALVMAIAMQFMMGVVLGWYLKTGDFNLSAFGAFSVVLVGLIAYILYMRGKLETYDE